MTPLDALLRRAAAEPLPEAPTLPPAPAAGAATQCEPHPVCANGLTAPGAPPRDLACLLGDVGYYRARDDDFRQRHPGLEPPPYYLRYGEKYAHRFTEETLAAMGPHGRAWLQQVFVQLQQSLEDLRARDPAGFDRLEQDPAAFQRFAYATHRDAYLGAGLATLSTPELLAIGLTPDVKDLLAPEGLEQAVAVGLPVLVEKATHLPTTLAIDGEELLRRLQLLHAAGAGPGPRGL